MFGGILETAASAAIGWSAARPREATRTTAILISPLPRLAPMGLVGIIAVGHLVYAWTK
jgi:hypothetical protein